MKQIVYRFAIIGGVGLFSEAKASDDTLEPKAEVSAEAPSIKATMEKMCGVIVNGAKCSGELEDDVRSARIQKLSDMVRKAGRFQWGDDSTEILGKLGKVAGQLEKDPERFEVKITHGVKPWLNVATAQQEWKKAAKDLGCNDQQASTLEVIMLFLALEYGATWQEGLTKEDYEKRLLNKNWNIRVAQMDVHFVSMSFQNGGAVLGVHDQCKLSATLKFVKGSPRFTDVSITAPGAYEPSKRRLEQNETLRKFLSGDDVEIGFAISGDLIIRAKDSGMIRLGNSLK